MHDMAEAYVGDLTPVDGVPKKEKSRREAETMDFVQNRLLGNVFQGASGKLLREAWQEYEDSKTLESHFVHDVDKVELLLQMVEYEKANDCEVDLNEFSWVASKVTLPEMKDWAMEILQEREDLWKSKGKESKMPVRAEDIEKQQDEYYARDGVEHL